MVDTSMLTMNPRQAENIQSDMIVKGSISINSENYSANELITALRSQGVSIYSNGSSLTIGQLKLSPISQNINNASLDEDLLNQNVIQGLTSQIQRIFGELNKLKDHLGINKVDFQDIITKKENFFDVDDIKSNSEFSTLFNEKISKNDKWSGFKPNKNSENKNIVNTKRKEDVPIITLGMKKNSPAIIDEFKDLTSNLGISEDEALDNLSSKLFSNANFSLTNNTSKQSIRHFLQPANEKIKETVEVNGAAMVLRKCENCQGKIPNEALFCSRCGKKL